MRRHMILSAIFLLTLCLFAWPEEAKAGYDEDTKTFTVETEDDFYSIEMGMYANDMQCIVIAAGIEEIPLSSFSDLTSLETVTIQGDHVDIGNSAFQNCERLESVTFTSPALEEGSIGNNAFQGCTALTDIDLPEGITRIGTNTFQYCSVLTSIDLPASLTSIGVNAFQGCSALTSIDLPDSVTSIGFNAFQNCTSLSEVDWPKGLKAIGPRAFNSTGLTSVIIPASVTTIGGNAFYNCDDLTSVTFNERDGEKLTIGISAFQDCSALTAIALPKGLETLDYDTFADCTRLSSVTLPESLTTIADSSYKGAFGGCTNLTSITLPATLTSIGDNAFKGSGLASITIPASVTRIGSGAFADCTGLTSFTIPDNVTELGSGAFAGCTGLTSMSIPSTVTSIGSDAFAGCTNLTSVTLPETLSSIGSSMFENCSSLTTLHFGASDSSSAGVVTLPDTVTSVGENAFAGCTRLSKISHRCSVNMSTAGTPESVTVIPRHDWNTEAWASDETGHWHPCAHEGCLTENTQKLGYAAHSYETDDHDCTTAASCTACAYQAAAHSSHNVTTWTSNDNGTHTGTCANDDCTQTQTEDCSYVDGICSKCGDVWLTITSQPQSLSVDEGDTATFAVTVGGRGTPAYQWQQCSDGATWTDIEGANDANLSLTATADMDGLALRCVVTSGDTTLTSEPATLSVTSDEPVTPPVDPDEPADPTPDPEPEIPAGPSTGESDGWESIVDEITAADESDDIVVDMGGTSEVPAEIFEDVAGKDVDLVFDMGDGLSWSVNGQDIPTDADLSDLDLGVSLGTDGIPVDVINAITGEADSIQLTLAYDGEFGFALTLTVPLGEENAGYWANLYHYDEDVEQLIFETAAKIGADGSVSLPLSHASQYAIVIDDHSHATVALPFTDVDESDWFYAPVVWVYGEGLMTGVSETEFAPDSTTTRAMIVAMLARLEGVTSAESAGFSDVSDSDWYATAVNWAASAGIVSGFDDGTFQPNTPVTREQLAAMLMNYAQWKGQDVSARAELSHYSDQPSAWASEAMSWSVAEGLIVGVTDDELQPQGNATRAQVAAIMQRFLKA